jgi:hypothetical protein
MSLRERLPATALPMMAQLFESDQNTRMLVVLKRRSSSGASVVTPTLKILGFVLQNAA